MNHLDEVAREESKEWSALVNEEFETDTIEYQEWTAETAEDYDESQRRLDNPSYQRQDLEQSCRELEIPWDESDTVFRMPGMSLSQQMQFWQPRAVHAIAQFEWNPLLRGCILADVMGIGKTWIKVCYILYVSGACNKLHGVLSEAFRIHPC